MYKNSGNHMFLEPESRGTPIDYCRECGEDLYAGDDVFEIDQYFYCKDCMDSFEYYYSTEEFSLSKDKKCNDCEKEFEEDEIIYVIPIKSNYSQIISYCKECGRSHLI